jgi:hypothetical protein
MDEYKRGGKVKVKSKTKVNVNQTVHVHVSKRQSAPRQARAPAYAQGHPLAYPERALPQQQQSMQQAMHEMQTNQRLQMMQLQKIQSHLNQPLPNTLPADRSLVPSFAYPVPAPLDISTNVNPSRDRQMAWERARSHSDLYPYGISGLSSGLVNTLDQEVQTHSYSDQGSPRSESSEAIDLLKERERPFLIKLPEPRPFVAEAEHKAENPLSFSEWSRAKHVDRMLQNLSIAERKEYVENQSGPLRRSLEREYMGYLKQYNRRH